MTTIVKVGAQKLTLRQQKGRAVNAVAEVLRKKLLVPNIYLEPPYMAVDVLAVDRAGSGDLHAVEIKPQVEFARAPAPGGWIGHERKRKVLEIRDRLMSLPAHYRYLAIPQDSCDLLMRDLEPLLYSADGIGRIGIITIADRGGEPPVAELSIAPERFRVDAAKLSRVEKNLIKKSDQEGAPRHRSANLNPLISQCTNFSTIRINA